MSKARRVIKRRIPIIRIILLITLVVGIIAGILIYNPTIGQEIASLIVGKVESYDINDFVKGAYTEDGNRYIPIYYNNYKEQITREDIINKFAERGVEVESISSQAIGTGTVIKTKSTAFGTTYNSSYTLIIYGDVNGDGKVNVLDINRIVDYIMNKGAGSSNLTGVYAKAANVQDISEGNINVRDINRIVGFIFYENAVVEVLPYSDRALDKTPPTIELEGKSTETVIIGEQYKDAGVTVSDNLDPHVRVTADPDPNGIDTSYEHTVTITYTAEDAAGNKSTVTRTVVVEPKSTVKIELKHPDKEYIALSLGEEYDPNWLGANAWNVKNGVEGESLQVTEPIWDKTFNKDLSGIYTVTYTASNSQDTGTVTQVIEVIDPVKTINLNVASAKARYDGKDITEDDELDLNDIIVTLNRKQNQADEEISLRNLLAKYKNQFEIKIDEFNGTKVTYTSPADNTAKVNTNLTVVLTWTNPAESATLADKTAQGTEKIGTANIIGKISKILTESTPKNTGDIYTEIEVAKFKTPASQEGFVDTATGDINVLKTEFVQGGATGHCDISDVTNGVATLTFWGETEGTYQIKVYTQNGKDPSQKIEYETIISITLTRSQAPNRILVTKEYNQEFLKAGGASGEYKLLFKRIYTNPDTGAEMPPYSVNVDNISVGYGANESPVSQYLTEKITRDSSNKTSATLELIPTDRDEQVNVTETVKIYVNGEEIPLYIDGKPSNLSVLIKAKAQYTFKFDVAQNDVNTKIQIKDDIKLYYKAPASSGSLEGSVKNIDGTLYTLYGVSLVDQYGDRGKDITNTMITTNTDSNYTISFKDNGTQKIIKTKGFKADGSVCVDDEDVVIYIGIGIDQAAFAGDEDEEFVARGLMKGGANSIQVEQSGTIVAKLNVKEIVKNDITSLRTNNTSSSDYRYSVDEETGSAKKPRIIGQIKSGTTQENLTPSDLTYKVEDSSLNDVTSQMIIDGELSSTGLGRINIRFRSPKAGKYKVTVGVRNKPSVNTSFDITITEDPRINMVKFTGNRKVTPTESFGEVMWDNPVTREIIYYHDYSDVAGNGVLPVELGIDGSVPVISGGNNPSTITINSNSNFTVTAMTGYAPKASDIPTGSGEKVNYIKVKCNNTTTGSKSFVINIDQKINDGITNTWSKELTVQATQVTSIEMQSVKISNLNDGNEGVLAYQMADADIPREYQTQIKNIGGTTCSIFKIWYEDKSGAPFRIRASEITGEQIIASKHKVLVTDDKINQNEMYPFDTNILVKPLRYEDDGSYHEEFNDDKVDYVGIALTPISIVSTKTEIGAFLNPASGWRWTMLGSDSKLTVKNVLGSPETINLVKATAFNVGDLVEEPTVKAKVDDLPKVDMPVDDTPSVSMPDISSPEQAVKPEESDTDGSAEIVTKPNDESVTEEDSKPSGEETKPEETTKPEDTVAKPNGTVSDKPKEPEDKKEQDNLQSDLEEE